MDSWKEEARRFLLDEEDEDDELFFVMVPALQLCLYDENMPEHTSLPSAKEVKEIFEGREKRCEDHYSIQKCIDIVDAMEDLTDEQKADANELFQSEINRQIFVSTKNPNVRLIWLKRKISQLSKSVSA